VSDRDIIDDIDALVDEQMAGGEPIGGYDYGDPDYPRCPHCSEGWHGLKITARMREMRWGGAFDEGYRYAEDDSDVLCPGSDFIGPWATREELRRIRAGWPTGNPWMRFPVPPGFRTRHAFDFQIGWRDPAPRPAGFTYHLPADVDSSGHIAGTVPDGPPQQIGRDFAVGGVIPPEEQFAPEFGGFAERIRHQYEEIRRLAADTAVPSATYQPMQRLVAGDRVVIESEGRRHEVVVVSDPVQHPDGRIEYTTEDPRYSARAQQLASIRDRVRRMGDVAPSVNDALNRMFSAYGTLASTVLEQLSRATEGAVGGMRGYSADMAIVDELEPETPQQRALPRPSTTPPMWAVQPNRRNRRRNR